MAREIRVGTRGSALALAQAREVCARLSAAHGGTIKPSLNIIKTSGDAILDRALSTAGGKGLFTKELEEALLSGEIDIAVHSMKDMPPVLPEGLSIQCLLPREDVRDAFVSTKARSLSALPKGAVLGTASVRREAQIKRLRPDIKTTLFRGNVQTRLRKLEEGAADATILACAGLRRLGLISKAAYIFDEAEILPAPAQGAIGIEARDGDAAAAAVIAPLHHDETATEIAAERGFLSALDGSCRTPIAGLARLKAGEVWFRGMILTPDGVHCFEAERKGGKPMDAAAIGLDAAMELLDRGGREILRQAA